MRVETELRRPQFFYRVEFDFAPVPRRDEEWVLEGFILQLDFPRVFPSLLTREVRNTFQLFDDSRWYLYIIFSRQTHPLILP